MKTQELIKAFNPNSYSNQKRARLVSKLDELDELAKQRLEFIYKAHLRCFRSFLRLSPIPKPDPNILKIYGSIPKDRLPLLEAAIAQSYDDYPNFPDAGDKFRELSFEEKISAICFIASQYKELMDETIERKSWNLINDRYQGLLAEFPDIILTEEDIERAITLGNTLRENKDELKIEWEEAEQENRTHCLKALMHKAYPEDDIYNLHIASRENLDLNGTYIAYFPVDTMVIKWRLLECSNFTWAIKTCGHEFQHRRQYRLVEKLKSDELEPHSDQHYQARLFKVNVCGGYLQIPSSKNFFRYYARMAAYHDQPVEQHANETIRHSFITAGEGFPVEGIRLTRIERAESRLAYQIDAAAFHAKERVLALLSRPML